MDAVIEPSAAEQRPPPAGVSFAVLVQQAQDDIALKVEKAGLGRDPYRFLMGALSHTLGLFPAFIQQLDGAIERARQPVGPEALERLEQAAATGASLRAAELARAHTHRILLAYGGAFVVSIIMAAGGAFAVGHSVGSAALQAADRRVAAAFQDGPAAASAWANLMEQNDLPRVLGMCVGPRAYTDATGRKVCLLPMYVEPPRRSPSIEATH